MVDKPSSPYPANRPVFGIAGWKKSGKTTLTTRLIAEFTARGLKVASIKHAHHDFRIDDEDTDSARHRKAGSGQVAIVSSQRWALVTELNGEPEPDLCDVIASLGPCDLVLVEGYKSAAIPKIEARRTESFSKRPLSLTDPMVLAVASDHPCEAIGADGQTLPLFDLDNIEGIADFIAKAIDGEALTNVRPRCEVEA